MDFRSAGNGTPEKAEGYLDPTRRKGQANRGGGTSFELDLEFEFFFLKISCLAHAAKPFLAQNRVCFL